MRILHVIDQIGIEYAGSALSARKLSVALAARGHEVILYTSDAGTMEVLSCVKVRTFKTSVTLMKSIRITPAMLFADYGKFDIIHLHNYYTFQNFAAMMNKQNTPVLLEPHGTFVYYDRILPHRWVQDTFVDPLWRLWFLGGVNAILCCSSLEHEQILRVVKHIPTYVVPHGRPF